MDRGIVDKLAEIGFLGASLPADAGGMGLDTISYCLVMEELGRADSSVRGIVSVQNGLVGKTVAKWATEEQRAEWLPRLASGEALGCYALTEPGSRSDPASLTTRAERDGDDWLITGSKIFITLGTWAKLALDVRAHGRGGRAGITCFLVSTDSEGYEARPIKGSLASARRTPASSSSSASVCRTRRGSAARARGSRSRCPRSTTGASRLRPGASGLPRAASCLRGVRGSRPSSKPIAGFQLVQAALRDRRRDGCGSSADVAGGGAGRPRRTPHARVLGCEVLRERGVRPRGERGGAGARRLRLRGRVPGGQYLRDARVTTLYEGTSQVQKLIIGRAYRRERVYVGGLRPEASRTETGTSSPVPVSYSWATSSKAARICDCIASL